MKSRKQKLVKLSKLYNLETGKRNKDAFHAVDLLFEKAVKKKALDLEIVNCDKCEGLNIRCMTEAAIGCGNLNATIMLVGQSLCTQCMNTGMPFTRGSGYLIDSSLSLADLSRKDVFITNLVHCHPLHNRASEDHEIRNCAEYLLREIRIVRPELVITLGADARESFARLTRNKKLKYKVHNVKHPAYFLHAGFEGAVEWMISLATIMEKYS